MKLADFIKHTPLDTSLLLGFYGGGNYGDELLLEVLAGLYKQQGIRGVRIAFQHPEHYHQLHHDFGYKRVNMHDKRAVFKAILRARSIVVGGGGLWGMDTNTNIFLMSVMLLVSRFIFGKKIYLLAVGYYDSAPRLGRVSAWCAGKAAHAIIARDQESYRNFKTIQSETYKDQDIVWQIGQLDLAPYAKDLADLEQRIHITDKTVFMTLRRFNSGQKHHLAAVIGQCLQQNTGKPIIIGLLEPRHVDPAGYELLQSWQRAYPNVQIVDFSFNPLALYLLFKKYHKQLLFVGPQFHAILSAHLTGVPYLPLAYDNKVLGLLKHIAPGAVTYAVHNLRAFDVQRFIDSNYGQAT